MSDLSNLVRVQRDGRRGWHWIDKAKFDATPSAYVVVDESGKPIAQEGDDDLAVGKGPGGKFYIKRGKERLAGPFESEEEAGAKLAEMAEGGE